MGGTKTLIGLFRRGLGRPEPAVVREFATLDFDSLDEIVGTFLDETGATQIDAACIGAAGQVSGLVARLTNVPWLADAEPIFHRIGDRPIELLNDLEAMAHVVPALGQDEVAVLQEGMAVATGNAALIAAGTGLGEALLHNINGKFVPAASEGGHADFSARTPREFALVQELSLIYGRVDVERVVSGRGLVNLFLFTHGTQDVRTACRVLGPDVDSFELPAAGHPRGDEQALRTVRRSARHVRRGLRFGSGQPGVAIGRHGRHLHRRRHRTQNSPGSSDRAVHERLFGQGAAERLAAHNAGRGHSQSCGWAAWRGCTGQRNRLSEVRA
jgi:glucokinase